MAPHPQTPLQSSNISRTRLFVIGSLAALTFIVVRKIYLNLRSPLRKVPGHFLARFTRLWEVYAVLKHDFPTYNAELHKKYGKVSSLTLGSSHLAGFLQR